MLDWLRIDADVGKALSTWRQTCGQLRQADAEVPVIPLAIDLLRPERMAELEEYDEDIARALLAWLRLLRDERACFADRREFAERWRQSHRVEYADQPVTLASLRDGVLSNTSPPLRRRCADFLARLAGPLSDHAIAAICRRFERERGAPFGSVSGIDQRHMVDIAEKLLVRTNDVCAEAMQRGWPGGILATLGHGAQEGWPARLTRRWSTDVFDPSASEGLRLHLEPPPRVWGACSFARALGNFGVAMLEAGRPATVPRALHERPAGVRRHGRRALFASVMVDAPFAKRVLGLGRQRARVHQREMALAFGCSLRIDALRVLLGASLRAGKGAARECFAEQTARLFDVPLPASLLGVLPQLRPGDGAHLVGSLVAAEQRDQLVAEHDEDWFRNPRALSSLRDADGRPYDEEPLAPERALAAIDTIGERLEQAPW